MIGGFKVISDIGKKPSMVTSSIFNLVSRKLTQKQGSKVLETAYKLDKVSYTNNEFLGKISEQDSMALYNTILSISNLNLFVEKDIGAVVNEYKEMLEREMAANRETIQAKNKECSKNKISKRYDNIEALMADNNKTIFYDMEYDDTPYVMKDDYFEELSQLDTPDEKVEFMKQQLVQNLNMAEQDAETMAISIINETRTVENGSYAILNIKQPEGLLERKYYIRENNVWNETQQMIRYSQVLTKNSVT